MSTSTSYKDKITIITFTHLWRNAPSTKLIERMLDSIYSFMDIDNCKHIINYDKKGDSEREEQYLKNLNTLKDKFNNNIKITTHNTLSKKRSYIYSELVEKCNTKYIILWEHDFILEKYIDIEKIVKMMDKNNEINYIKFNKRDTHPTNGIDKWLEDENNFEVPLVKFCGYNGNPHIERREWFLKYCKPLIYNIPILKKNSIERAMNKDIMRRRKRFGFDKTHKFLGTYIYGSVGDKRYVNSLDIYKSKEAWGNKNPNKKWKIINEE